MSQSEETRIALLEQSTTNIMDKLNEYQEENREQHKELKEMIEKALLTKAGKWTEGVIKWVGISVGVGVLGYFGTLIIKVIEMQ
jgi:hypothetical protein